jgi:hypothetical protein
MQEMRQQGIVVPTRGEIQDIGPTVSHKTFMILRQGSCPKDEKPGES